MSADFSEELNKLTSKDITAQYNARQDAKRKDEQEKTVRDTFRANLTHREKAKVAYDTYNGFRGIDCDSFWELGEDHKDAWIAVVKALD
jgi:hypothetical protein